MNFIPNIYKTSSNSSLHLLRRLFLLLLSSIPPAAVFVLAFFGFAFLQHNRIIIAGVTVNFTISSSCDT
jgi:hypothetical protein